MTSSSDGLRAPFALARARNESGEAFLGLVRGDRIRRLSAEELGAPDLNAFLAEGYAAWDRLESLSGAEDGNWVDLDVVKLTAPVTPRQVLQTGANYRTHVIDLVAAGASQDQDRFPTK